MTEKREALVREPLLAVTNPIWLWLFRHGWEDPNWGRSVMGQVSIAATIHELSGQIVDESARSQIRAGARDAALNAAKQLQ